MHGANLEQTGKPSSAFEGVTRYHWLVVIIASFGWLFDCMDQRIFILCRQPALQELLKGDVQSLKILGVYADCATAAMMFGWAAGGVIFGTLSDKYGRVKAMIATLLVYSGFTGLSGTAGTVTQLIVYRFLVGLGVGGMFGAATTLVAESVPANFRTLALGSLQALSAMGNVTGSMISWFIRPGTPQFLGDYSGWRVLFFVGILPSLLVIPIILVLREPDAWKQAKAEAASGDAKKKVGDINELFKNPRWRRNSLCGLGLGAAGMIGLWAIGFFSPELITMALKDLPQTKVDSVKALGTGLQDTGAFIGMLVFTWVAARLNRRKAFLGAFLLCFIVTVFVFNMLKKESHAYWMLPMMGFAQLSVFAGYSIYFPELFPTRLRGSGVGLCYNTVRCITALFLFFSGFLKTLMPFRTAATVMSVIFLLGIVVLIWAPETKGKPLPEG